MGSKARNYSQKTLKRLFGLSGNQCSFPGCKKMLINDKNASDSNICHIEAANPDGERYREDMTDKERADFSNLILLCPQHHKETDDVEKYTVSILKKMKQDHQNILLNQKFKSNPSMLSNAISALADIELDDLEEIENLNSFNPSDKINYNCIKRNVSLINEYKVYHTKINSLYEELEKQGSIKKIKLLRTIRQIYIQVKGKFVLDSENYLELVRDNSDNIFDAVIDELYHKMEDSTFWEEDIVFSINLIVVDAFMRCKILEEPIEV